MLQVSRRGGVQDQRVLSLQEDRALRQAFGRYAEPDARAAGAGVVHRYQRTGAGGWFLCDCLGQVDRPPALVPVAEAHIRRHHEPPWPDHDPECDFYRDAAEQRAITRSYARLPDGKRVALLARLKTDERTRPQQLTGRSFARSRGALATLLMHLIEDSGLNQVQPLGGIAALGEQYKAMRRAAQRVEIDEGVPLSEFLCTYPPALPDLCARIARVSPSLFRKSQRPHGVLISAVADASVGNLRLFGGEALPVRGEIAVFGEREGHTRQTAMERRSRSPYLAVCLVGRSAPTEPVEVLKAYLHPCVSPGHLMPMDSNHERSTFRLLQQLQAWLLKNKSVSLAIKKPVFDLSSPPLNSGPDPESAIPSGPCIPDFLLATDHVSPAGVPLVIVETMGYADVGYRERKQRIHPLMSESLNAAPVVVHDFHLPADQSQPDRDRRFWLRCRWTVAGREPQIG